MPWGILAQRERTDAAVQEAELALPFAYGKLDVHGRAAVSYASALDSFGAEIEKLDAEDIEKFGPEKVLKGLGGILVPGGFGVRFDSHVHAGYTVSQHYDSLIGKLIVSDTGETIQRVSRDTSVSTSGKLN